MGKKHHQDQQFDEEDLSGTAREILLLRKKLEIRSWFLRASLALNAGVIAGIVVKLLS